MIVRWTEKAFLSLEEITHYISDDDVEAAIRTAQQIYDRVEDLIMFPHRGRPGRKQGTRELVLAPLPYFAVYRVKDVAIEILQIRHGARLQTPRLPSR